MRPGDFVTTPNWAWHDHGNETDEPMMWLDGLDMPFVLALNAMFYEELGDGYEIQPVRESSTIRRVATTAASARTATRSRATTRPS